MAHAEPRGIITTSWDDGHPLDARLAGLLDRYGMRGTFYVPLRYAAIPRMTAGAMRELQAMGMEIGAHTVTHRRLTEIPPAEAFSELARGKAGLEHLLGERVRSFCYPEGKFSRRLLPLVRRAGYDLARTTVAFRTDAVFDPYRMPVTFQVWPHSRQVLARHACKEGNFAGLVNWAGRLRGESDLESLAGRLRERVERSGGIVHIWGHSWEIEQHGLWSTLERVLARLSGSRSIAYLTNGDIVNRAVPHYV